MVAALLLPTQTACDRKSDQYMSNQEHLHADWEEQIGEARLLTQPWLRLDHPCPLQGHVHVHQLVRCLWPCLLHCPCPFGT